MILPQSCVALDRGFGSQMLWTDKAAGEVASEGQDVPEVAERLERLCQALLLKEQGLREKLSENLAALMFGHCLFLPLP